MPLPPLPPNNTRRVFVDYNDGQHDHTMMFRAAASASSATLQGHIHSFLTALSPALYEITILGVRESASGSDVTNPVVVSLDPTYGENSMPAELAPRQYCFVGRSFDGRKVKLFVYGPDQPTPGDYRFQPDENADLDAAIASLQASSSFIGLTISGFSPLWHTYTNINFNSYWERQARV